MARELGGVWKLADAIRRTVETDAPVRMVATVQRVEDGVTWVIPVGSDEAIPVNGTQVASAAVDEIVTIEIGSGRASLTGNATDPAVGAASVETRVSVVREAIDKAAYALGKATATAQAIADEAKAVAEATNQHFWTDGDGIHVTEAEQEDWEANHTGANVLLNSLGQLFRDGLNNLVSITSGATAFYDGLGNAASNIIAQFGREGVRIGKAAAAHFVQSATSAKFYDSTGSRILANITTFDVDGHTAAELGFLNDRGMLYAYEDNDGSVHLLVLGGEEVSSLDGYDSASIELVDAHLVSGTAGSADAVYSDPTIRFHGEPTFDSPVPRTSGGTGSDSYGTQLATDIDTAVSVADSTWVSLGSVSLAAGTWLITFGGYFSAGTKALMRMCLSTSTPSAAELRRQGVSLDTTASTNTSETKQMHGCVFLTSQSDTTYRLCAWQDSGGAKNAVGNIRAFRLR